MKIDILQSVRVILLFYILFFNSLFSYAQGNDVVKDTVSFYQEADTIRMVVTLKIDSSWIVYDSISGVDGPIPFSINFEAPSGADLKSIKKPVLHKKFDELFEMDIYYLEGTVSYVFSLEKNDLSEGRILSGSYEFMSCNLFSGVCLPPTQHSFSYNIK